MVAAGLSSENGTIRYDRAGDRYLSEADGDDPEEWGAVMLGGVTYYPIGAGSWTWDFHGPNGGNPYAGVFWWEASSLLRSVVHHLINSGRQWGAGGDPLTMDCAEAELSETDETALRALLTRVSAAYETDTRLHRFASTRALLATIAAGGSFA